MHFNSGSQSRDETLDPLAGNASEKVVMVLDPDETGAPCACTLPTTIHVEQAREAPPLACDCALCLPSGLLR